MNGTDRKMSQMEQIIERLKAGKGRGPLRLEPPGPVESDIHPAFCKTYANQSEDNHIQAFLDTYETGEEITVYFILFATDELLTTFPPLRHGDPLVVINFGGTAWEEDVLYKEGDKRIGSDGYMYTCKSEHTSTKETKPQSGADWGGRWERTGKLGGWWNLYPATGGIDCYDTAPSWP